MKKFLLFLLAFVAISVSISFVLASEDAMDEAFLRISVASTKNEIKTIAEDLGLRYNGIITGTGTYLIRITRTSKHSVSNRFSPNDEKQDCIAIELDQWHNEAIKKIEYFSLSRMMSYIYFGEQTKYHDVGYHCVDYNSIIANEYHAADGSIAMVSYVRAESAAECLQHLGSVRDNANNPLIRLFTQLNSKMTWVDISEIIGEYGLYCDEKSARQSSTYDYTIACAENVSTSGNQRDSGNYLVISVNRKTGELVEAGIYFLESTCVYGISGHYYTANSFWPGYYGVDPGYYTYDSSARKDKLTQYDTADSLIDSLLP